MNPSEQEGQDPFESLFKKLKLAAEAKDWEEAGQKAVQKATDEGQKKIEEILFKLWSYLQENSAHYQESFMICRIFDQEIRHARNKVYRNIPGRHIPEVFHKLGDMCHLIAEMHQAALDASEKHKASAPEEIQKIIKQQLLEDDE